MKITIEIPDNELKSILSDVLGNVPALKASVSIGEPIEETAAIEHCDLDLNVREVFSYVRLWGVFLACDIHTLRDLLRFSMNELMRCRGFGRRAKQAVEETLKSLNLTLASQPEIWYWCNCDYGGYYSLRGSQGSRMATKENYRMGAERIMDELNEKIRNEKR